MCSAGDAPALSPSLRPVVGVAEGCVGGIGQGQQVAEGRDAVLPHLQGSLPA